MTWPGGRRIALALAAGALLVGAGRPAEADPSGTVRAFQNYLVGAMAPGYQITEDAPNATFHPQGEGDYGYSLATMTKATSYALSSLLWPGSAAGNAGTLVSVLGVQGQTSALNDPVRAEATSGTPQTNQTVSGPGGAVMSASVVAPESGEEAATSRTSGGSGALGPGNSTGASSSDGATLMDPSTGTLTATSDTSASDLVLAGGLIKVGSVVSRAQARSQDAGTVQASGLISVAGMQVAAQAAYVDGSGVHLGRPGKPSPPAEQAAVDAALRSAGMQIYFTSPHRVRVGGVVYYVAASVLFYWPVPHDPSGDSFTLSIGGAAVSMGVTAGLPAGSSGAGAGEVPAGAASSAGPVSDFAAPPARTVLSLPTDSEGASISGALGRAPLVTGSAAAGLPALPVGVGGWWVLIALGALVGGAGLTRLPALLGRRAEPVCPLERRGEGR